MLLIGGTVYHIRSTEFSPFVCWWRILAQRLEHAGMLFEGLNRTTHNFLLWVEIALWAEIVCGLRLYGGLKVSFGVTVTVDENGNRKERLN
ncbi:hypothetical protein CWO34_04800 [Vibrio splendidus]|nr:hypothetical protein BCS86_11480 [Vibrio splendidus]PTO78242.1 hypothetical protein CWN93_19710 [Vibrio splendidus]PTQ00601.1 hypothetical protein CWO34_04800 [Vibrio splendidus]